MTNGGRAAGLARLQLLVAAVLFSTGGAAIKATTLDGWQVAGLRAGIAAVFLLVALPRARGRWSLRALPVALAFAAALFFFVLANKNTTAASAIFLVSTSPLYIVVLSPWLLGEHLRRRELVLLALIAIGMSLLFVGIEPSRATAPNPTLGKLLAIIAGVAWALTVIGLRWLSRGKKQDAGSALPAVVFGNSLLFLVCLPRIVAVTEVTLTDVGVVTYLGVVQIGVAYVFLTAAIRSVHALEASLLLMAEPVLSPVWAWWLHGEVPGQWALAGGALILAATALPGVYDAWRRSFDVSSAIG